MTNQEYTEKYISLNNLHLEGGSLLRYVDREGLKVGFVVDVGDAGDQYGIEEYRSYPYKVVRTINDRLKKGGFSTIKTCGSERSLSYYISRFSSSDYRFANQVLLDGNYIVIDCSNCEGTGINPDILGIPTEDCSECNGTG